MHTTFTLLSFFDHLTIDVTWANVANPNIEEGGETSNNVWSMKDGKQNRNRTRNCSSKRFLEPFLARFKPETTNNLPIEKSFLELGTEIPRGNRVPQIGN
uniref:Uncharacterized protein n=1 Tax=Cacopsylla melanoneura TaxID=428564 RepID=A0A8D8RIJ9_9HEMI